MRYVYCRECKEPISAKSTFDESVIRGITPKKKLKSTCGKSHIHGTEQRYCKDCYMELKKQFNKIGCDCKTCRLQIKGNCTGIGG